jgi:type IV secretion system protein VirD4
MGWLGRPQSRTDSRPKVLIGKLGDEFIEFEGDEHVALLARTGTGKTTGFTKPNCFHHTGSLVVLDIKAEAWDDTAGFRAETLGQEVYRFDPTTLDRRSHCWNPLDIIDRTSINRFDQIIRLATLMIPEPPVTSGNAVFWDRVANMALSGVLMLLAEMPDQALTLQNVARIFFRSDGLQWLIDRIEESRDGRRRPFTLNAVLAVSDYIGQGQRLTEDVRKSVSSHLKQWLNPLVCAATSRSDFDLRNLRRKPMSLYVTVSPAAIERLAPLLRLLFGALVNFNTDTTPQQDPSLNVPVLVILDEFVRLGAMPALTSAAQFVRGYGVKLAYIIQDKPQLRALYGEAGAADVFNNLGAEIVFGLSDVRQAKEYEERLGNSTVSYETGSAARWFRWLNLRRMGMAEHLTARPLKFAWEIVQMPEDEQLVLRPGMRPALTQRIRSYAEPYFIALKRDPPDVPLLPINIEVDDGSIAMPDLRQSREAPSDASNGGVPAGIMARNALPRQRVSPQSKSRSPPT